MAGRITLVNFICAGTTSANAAVTTGNIDTTTADLLVAVVTNYQVGGLATVSDSASNTWTTTTARANGANGQVQILYVSNPTTSSSHSVTIAAATNSLASVTFMAFKGAALSSPFDQEAGSTSTTTGSITPTQDNELIVMGYADSASTSIFSAGASANAWTGPMVEVAGLAVIASNRFAHFTGIAYQNTAAAITMSVTANFASNPVTSVVSFKAATISSGSSGGAYAFA